MILKSSQILLLFWLGLNLLPASVIASERHVRDRDLGDGDSSHVAGPVGRDLAPVTLYSRLQKFIAPTKADQNKFNDPNSPQSKALAWLQSDPIANTPGIALQSLIERYVIVLYAFSTRGCIEYDICPEHTDPPTPTCDWDDFLKVTCSTTQPKTVVGLEGYNSGPQLPWELSLLTNLVSLDLNDVGWEGTIPVQFSKLAKLTFLDMEYSHLVQFPAPSTLPPQLKILNLAGCEFPPGKIPVNSLIKLKNLEWLSLEGNSFTGVLPATELAALKKLTYLDLSRNELVGPLPIGLCNLASIQELHLERNTIGGVVPNCGAGKLPKLKSLHLEDNELVGPLPTGLCNLASIEEMFFASNKIGDPFPTCAVGKLTKLRLLDLKFNQLQAPAGLCNLANIQELYLTGNTIVGQIPDCVGSLTSLKFLHLDSNKLSGTLPTSLCNLANVEEMVLRENDIC